jgi:hypothetical protein
MIIKVKKEEGEMVEYCCAVYALQCYIFTMESNPKMVQVEILHSDGGDLDATTAWLLCKSVNCKMERA